MFKNFICRYIDWSELKKIPGNKLVATSYIWIVIVPIAAKITSKIEDVISFEVGNIDHQLVLELPFSWQLFFWSALFFTVGNALFLLLCPFIVKRYENFEDFKLRGGKFSGVRHNLKSKDVNILLKIRDNEFTNPEESFWIAYNADKITNIYSRLVIFSTYFIGFLLFSFVAASNILWVIVNGHAF
jgi:hypothetical protein